MKEELKNALMCEKVKKGSKVAFVFLHIANVLFNLLVIPKVYLIPTWAQPTTYQSYDQFMLTPSHDALMMGLIVGGVLLVVNFFIIRFLKNFTTWYIQSKITE